jgi:hypothetical protein
LLAFGFADGLTDLWQSLGGKGSLEFIVFVHFDLESIHAIHYFGRL